MNSIYYNGNPQIKKAGISQDLTAKQIEEYLRCQEDPIYFIEKYVKIISLNDGLVFFDMWDFQKRMIRTFHDNRFVINLLPRQMGKTITVAAFLLHHAIFNPDTSIGILANKAATAREILSRMKRMLENLPFFLQPGVKTYNKGSVEFGNGSSIMASATSSDSIRGFSFNVIYLDEFAFVDGADEFYTSTYPVISSGDNTKVIITSTPNGMNLFYKLWTEAKMERNDYVPVEVHWSENPNRDKKWEETTRRNIGDKQFSQEYGCSFYGSSNTLIDGEKLATLTWYKAIEESENMKIYERPKDDHTYIMTVDVSEGVGGDYSVINLTDISETPYKQVAVWRNNKTTPIVLPEIVERIAKMYNDAYVLIETNTIGHQVSTTLFHEYEYENIIITTVQDGNNNVSGGFSNKIDYGIRMTKKSKRIGCSNIKTLIESDLYMVTDFDTVSELQSFIKKGQSYEAEDQKFDDIAMTLVSFGWLSTQDYFEDLSEFNSRKLIMDSKMQLIEDELTPLGFFHNDFDHSDPFQQNDSYLDNEHESSFL